MSLKFENNPYPLVLKIVNLGYSSVDNTDSIKCFNIIIKIIKISNKYNINE